MILLFMAIATAVSILAHTAPAPFVLDALHADRVIWRMPHDGVPPTIYLTFDDGPNAQVTPGLLDVLAAEGVPATFFLIDDHVTDQTASLVRRIAQEGHAIGLHSASRRLLVLEPAALAATVAGYADRIEALTGARPCRAFRPHAGWRGTWMLEGLERLDYQLVGWGWMLWDFEPFRPRDARIVPRLVRHASPGDIIVIHDGHHADPRVDRSSAVAITRALIPALRAKGFGFGRICP